MRFIIVIMALAWCTMSTAKDQVDRALKQCILRYADPQSEQWSSCYERGYQHYWNKAERYYLQQMSITKGVPHDRARQTLDVFRSVRDHCGDLQQADAGYQHMMICRLNIARQFAQTVP